VAPKEAQEQETWPIPHGYHHDHMLAKLITEFGRSRALAHAVLIPSEYPRRDR